MEQVFPSYDIWAGYCGRPVDIPHVGSVETGIFLVGQTEVVFPLIDILTWSPALVMNQYLK